MAMEKTGMLLLSYRTALLKGCDSSKVWSALYRIKYIIAIDLKTSS